MTDLQVHPEPCPFCLSEVVIIGAIGDELFLQCITCRDTRLVPKPSGDHE